MKKLVIALAAVAATSFAVAQQGTEPPAKVSSVEGLATVTSGNQLVNVTAGMALPEGGLLMVTQGATVTVQFKSGCTATLVGGQSLTISDASCEAFARLPASQTGTLTARNIGYGAAGILTAGLLYRETRSNNDQPTIVLPVTPTPVDPISPN